MSARAHPGSRVGAAVAAFVVALVVSHGLAVADDDVPYRRMKFAERGAHLVVSTEFGELISKKAADKLSSGLPTNVVVRVYVYRKDDDLPVSLAISARHVVYDLWKETYLVRTEGPDGTVEHEHTSKNDALRAMTSLESFPIADLERIPVGPHHFLAMVVELNPVSEETLAEARRWLSRSAADRRFDSGSSFFGSFVSVFVNPKLKGADRVLKRRSQPFYRVPH